MNNYTEDHCSICELSSGKPCKHPIALVVRATYGVDILIVILTISFMEKKLFLVKIHMLQSARTVATVYAYLKKIAIVTKFGCLSLNCCMFQGVYISQ